MKTILKNLVTATFVILLVAAGATAQEKTADKSTFKRKLVFEQFENSLKRIDYPGVVESTLFTTVECKNRYPDLNYSSLLDAVNKVAQENNDPALAYKAYLVSMYFAHSSDIRVNPFESSDDHDQLFKQIADQLEAKFLAFDSNENIADKK